MMNNYRKIGSGWGLTGPHPNIGYFKLLETFIAACEEDGDATFPVAITVPTLGPTFHLLIQREGEHALAVIYLLPEQYPELGIQFGQDMTKTGWQFIPAREKYPNTALMIGKRNNPYALAQAICKLLTLLAPESVVTGPEARPGWQKPDS